MSESALPTEAHKSAARDAVECAKWYVLLVACFALLRGAASFIGWPAWIIESMSWPEIFYGPAIAMGVVFANSHLNPKVEAWLRRRRESGV